MDWESLKYVLATGREGTLAGAGRVLGVNHSTVIRRIAALEQELGLKLFDHRSGGYMLTAAGRDVLNTLVKIDEDLVVLERKLSGRDLRLAGTVRVGAIGVLVSWIAPALAHFRNLHPGIKVDVVITPSTVSLDRHEADIAIRVGPDPPDGLVGRRIATVAFGVYAATTHPAPRRPAPDLAEHDWITYTENRSEVPQAKWVAAHVPADRIVLRANHTGMIVAAVKAGAGLGVLPCYLGDCEPDLHRLTSVGGLGVEMWILTHSDLRQTPRVRVLMDFLARALACRRDLIEGRAGPDDCGSLPPCDGTASDALSGPESPHELSG